MSNGGKAGSGPTRLGGSGAGSDPGSTGSVTAARAPSDAGASASMSMSTGEDSSMVGEVLDGRYRITKKLGEGGMGEVYAAEHVHIAKRVAIKLLRKEVVSNAEAVSRFRQEARSASTIGHRNIIGIDDFGQLADGRIYLCMEYLDGAPLNDMITQPLPHERLLNILIQTGHGLAAAHAKGIVHRDMKPENIFVTVTPQGEDIPKLLDFGIAKVGGQDGSNNLTKTGTIFGTPYYMAPEQALGQAVDARVDVYALGVILYEVFSGSLPFQGESFMGVLTQHITTDPEPVAQRAAKAGRTLPPGLAELITKALAKDPDRRFRTMDELVNGLVAIYRNVAGAGMSSYLEVQGRASASQPSAGGPPSGLLPTMAAPAGGSAHAMTPPGSAALPATVVAPGGALPPTGSSGPHGAAAPGYPHGSPSGPMQAPGSGPMPLAGPGGPMGPPGSFPPPYGPGSYGPGPMPGAMPGHPGASGMYPGDSGLAVPHQKKSKAGLIAILLAAVVVIGGVVAVVVLTSSKKKDEQVAAGGLDAAVPQPVAVDAGSAAPAVDAALAVTPDLVDAAAPAVDARSALAETVVVLIHSPVRSAVVYDNGTRLGKVPQTVMVAAGEEREVVLKAPGYKDEKLTVDGREPRHDITMKAIGGGPGTGRGTGNGTGAGTGRGTGAGTSKPPPGPDCDNNPTDPRCGL